MSLTKINGLLLSRMIIAGANELTANKQLVDAMNVFPVPDGDTGTNMSLTVLAAAKEAEKNGSLRIDEVSKAAASGALRGARGNSGVITSQLFRGFSKGLEGLEEADVQDLKIAIKKGVETAYKAVMKPKEGTILTVARACAEAGERLADETTDIEQFLNGVIAYGHEVLDQTPDMLPVLKQAGVVDAGGRGLLFVLEGALRQILEDNPVSLQEIGKSESVDFSALTSIETEEITFGYCTEFFINVKNSDDATVLGLQSYLDTIGDSVVCVNDEDIIKIHVHTDHPGLALEKALEIGSLSGLKIDNMREQHSNQIDFQNAAGAKDMEKVAVKDMPKKEVGFVAISAGAGLSDIFKNLGVDVMIEGGQTMNPSTEDILNAVEKINADHIVILPNNKNIILAAEQAVEICEGKTLHVIPTKSVPEGISAMFCYAEGSDVTSMVEAMKEAIQTVSTVAVTYAVRDTQFDGKTIQAGDILGMLNDKITAVTKTVLEGAKEALCAAITEDSEMIGIYYGADTAESEAEELMEFIHETYPQCEVEIHKGAQPLYYYIISVE